MRDKPTKLDNIPDWPSDLGVLQGAGAVICVWGSWRRRLRPTSPSLNLQSSSSWPFILSQTTSLSAPAHSPLPFHWSAHHDSLRNLFPWSSAWPSTQTPHSGCTHSLTSLQRQTDLRPPVTETPFRAWPEPQPPLAPSSSSALLRLSRGIHQLAISLLARLTLQPAKGTSEAYHSTGNLHKGPRTSPNDLQLQLRQVARRDKMVFGRGQCSEEPG